MKSIDIIIISILAVWFILALIYTVKSVKNGKCIGCKENCPNTKKTNPHENCKKCENNKTCKNRK